MIRLSLVFSLSNSRYCQTNMLDYYVHQ